MFLIGCSKESTEQNNVNPIEYIESFGWHVEEKISKEKLQTKSLTPDIAGIIDLKPYMNEEIHITTYLLKEKQKSGNKVYANIYQGNEDIIGGYGGFEGLLPGTFSLKDKKRLINEGIINK